jgi:hypothetical protein
MMGAGALAAFYHFDTVDGPPAPPPFKYESGVESRPRKIQGFEFDAHEIIPHFEMTPRHLLDKAIQLQQEAIHQQLEQQRIKQQEYSRELTSLRSDVDMLLRFTGPMPPRMGEPTPARPPLPPPPDPPKAEWDEGDCCVPSNPYLEARR